MDQFHCDLRDIKWTCTDLLKGHEVPEYELDKEAISQVIEEFARFAEKEISPTRIPSDHPGCQFKEGRVTVPECLHKVKDLYYENGWFGLGLSEELGGIPVPHSVTIACEGIGLAANCAWMLFPGLSRAALNVVLALGPNHLQEVVCKKMMKGEWGGTMCLTEPDAGSDVGSLKTTATPLGDGQYSLKGTKIFITGGDHDLYQNIIHMVLARTPGAPEGPKGISLFLVPKFQFDQEGKLGQRNGVECKKIEEKMGIHASPTCELTFGENQECVGHLVGAEMDGLANMFLMMNEARLICGLQGEAQGGLAWGLANLYAQERIQFGVSIDKHPDVKKMLSKMRAMIRGLRGLNLYTASLFDRKKSGDKEIAQFVHFLTPINKAYSSDRGFEVCVEALQVYGGYGYCREYGLEQLVRDVKIASIYEGTNGIQAIDLVLRKVAKDQGETLGRIFSVVEQSLQEGETETDLYGQRNMMLDGLKEVSGMMERFMTLIQSRNLTPLEYHATDILRFLGNLLVAWRLWEAAKLATRQLNAGDAKGESKEFLQEKVQDLDIFCKFFLSENAGISLCLKESMPIA